MVVGADGLDQFAGHLQLAVALCRDAARNRVVTLLHLAQLHEQPATSSRCEQRRSVGAEVSSINRNRVKQLLKLQQGSPGTHSHRINRTSTQPLEPGRRIELLTYALRVRCSTD